MKVGILGIEKWIPTFVGMTDEFFYSHLELDIAKDFTLQFVKTILSCGPLKS
jgi:hypothetical protein